MTKITIHTPSAGVRAVTVNGTAGRFKIRTLKSKHYLLDTHPSFDTIIGESRSVRALEFTLRDYLNNL